MIGLRPTASDLYLERPRLLRLLPDAPGYVVCLEAPYGYGKSVLATQWATHLERDGVRVAWLAHVGDAVAPALARVLDLPASAPWGVVLASLARSPTLVVLEDAPSTAVFAPLLEREDGWLLLASRARLDGPDLARVASHERLVRIDARQLAFDQEEAVRLLGDEERGRDAWTRTSGWPLPLHLAALTGEPPSAEVLVEGVRRSLDDAAWRELQLLASLRYLPSAAASDDTRRLAAAGFAQRVVEGYRVHALIADAVLADRRGEVRESVRVARPRLDALAWGEACERVGWLEGLAAVLEDPASDLDRRDPAAALRWHERTPGPAGAVRLSIAGAAACTLGRDDEGIAWLERAAELSRSGVDTDVRLGILAALVWFLAQVGRLDEARLRAEEGEALLDGAAPERAGRFLNNVSFIDYRAGAYAAAARVVERALARYPLDSPLRLGPLTNLAILRWNAEGDLDGRIALQREALALCRMHHPDALAPTCRDLARAFLILGDRAAALERLEEAERHAVSNPVVGLEARAMRAALDADPGPFAELWHAASVWEDAYTSDSVAALWSRALRVSGRIEAARDVAAERGTGGLTSLEGALALTALGEHARALEALERSRHAYPQRDYRVAWHAARYHASRDREDLAALLALVRGDARRILPGTIPLEALPRDEPDLARYYPMSTVLASDWPEAIGLRLPEAPPLEVRVMGRFEVRVLGNEVELVRRHREILTLLLLRASRDAIGAALWPDVREEKMRNNLAVQMNRLRRLIEPWRVPTYLVEERLERLDADLWHVEAALRAGDAATVLAVYREPFAPGVDLPLVDEARLRLRRDVVRCLARAADTAPSDLALACLDRVLELEPLDERAVQRLLTLLRARGRRTEAVARYHAFRSLLARELGLEPLPETTALGSPAGDEPRPGR